MPLDTSIYQTLRPVETPDILGSATKAATLRQLAMQQIRAQQGMMDEDRARAEAAALKETFAKHTGADGTINRPALLSDLYKINPDKAFAVQDHYQKQDDVGLERQYKQAQIAKLQADAYKARHEKTNPLEKLSPGQKSADQTFAKDAADYYYSGGKATVEKNFQKLEDSISALNKNPDLTGGLSTKLPWFGSDEQQDWMNPKLAAVRDDIRGAIQGSLKQILGGQFTEREAQSMFNRAFNPRLSAEENVRRAKAELEALRTMAGDKDGAMNYFEQTGTLVGFKPSKTNLKTASNDRDDRRQGAGGSFGMNEANADETKRKRAPLTPQDAEAIHWAKRNPADPRAQQILQMHGEN